MAWEGHVHHFHALTQPSPTIPRESAKPFDTPQGSSLNPLVSVQTPRLRQSNLAANFVNL